VSPDTMMYITKLGMYNDNAERENAIYITIIDT
jgi:hypothetical protein